MSVQEDKGIGVDIEGSDADATGVPEAQAHHRKARGLSGRVARWIDDRTGAAGFGKTALDKVFPNHWSFLLGEIALYSFIILVITGIFLTFFFRASSQPVIYNGSYTPLRGVEMSQAYASALNLSFDVRAGLVMRQIHHWAALVFVAAIVLHLCRIFFTGAFRRPREINWVVGVTLMLLAILNGFAGYSLLDDQLSGTGIRIAYSVLLSVPVIGSWMASLLFGGNFPGIDIIPRLFIVHVLLVPLAIMALLGIHLGLLVRQKHTQFRGKGATNRNVVGERVWPTYAFKALGWFFIVAAVLALLGGLAQINPIWMYGPFRIENVSSASQPDWYMGWLEGALRLMPNWEIRVGGYSVPNPFFGGVLIPGAAFTVLYLWPWLEARFTHDRREHHLLDRPRDRPLRTALGVTGLTFFTILGLAGSDDVLATTFGLSVNAVVITLRIAVIVVPVVAGFVAYRLSRELRERSGPVVDPLAPPEPEPEEGQDDEGRSRSAEVVGTAAGGLAILAALRRRVRRKGD